MCGISSWPRTAVLAAVVLAAAAPALPQQMQQRGDAFMPALHQPYDIETFGEFRKIIQQGDFDAKVQLAAAVMTRIPMTGVGAVAGARGEITIYDGNLIISYGESGIDPAAISQSAALLSVASTGEWQTVAVDRDVAPSEIESAISPLRRRPMASIRKNHFHLKSKARSFSISCTLMPHPPVGHTAWVCPSPLQSIPEAIK